MGYAVMAKRNTRVGIKGHLNVEVQKATLIARRNGYRHSRKNSETPREWKKPF